MSDIVVTLPDGSELSVAPGSTVEDVAYEIGPGLGEDTVGGIVDGDLAGREEPLEADCELVIITEDSEEYLRALRHSAAHVFAQALQRRFPEAKLAIGPPTDDGFYYDVAGIDLDADDLEAIEGEMYDIIEADHDIERVERSREEALDRYADNPYKQDILAEEAAGEETVSFYVQDGWEDLCRGPHVESTGEIGAVELLNIAAAYWRGDEDNDTLTRVYGTAFESEADLEEYLERREEAEKRDHRRLGREMDLFSIPDVTGPGLPLFHPNGKTVLAELEGYVDELNRAAGYDQVETPHVFRTELWKKSGHYDNYVDDMFLLDVNDEEYGLKPMNCPGHATIFDGHNWSYRDLPVRYFENGKVYRKEQRGELSGLSRTWAFTIDDGHLFVRPDQIVLESDGYDYDLEPGDGAFYGPKIDFGFEDALGRDWDGPTVQLDFTIPERFDLTYTGEDNAEHRPVMIHRALYGSYERFFMVLVEHFDGNFPTWLAPEQVRVLPISDDNLGYAKQVKNRYLDEFRVEIEDRSWTIGKKIQQAHDDRVPYMLVVGDDEEQAGTVSVRDRFEEERNGVDVETFREHLRAEVAEKRVEPDFVR
ncbi:threonine--tRNA ligase [Halobacteriales archaeon QS_4_69_225]|nr:MAG: threonine--tRNA ligase [Halobacteriales archaeon QS_4_69_225]